MLTWNAPSSTAVADYRVYYGKAPGTYDQQPGAGIATGSATNYTVSGLQSGSTYYFTVTSVDGSGNESAPSNEVSKTVQ